MALDAELIGLKSAGVYRFERDKTDISNEVETTSNLRLVVGFSKIGPFNTVKLVNSTSQFIKLYGNIDRTLEKKGSFFHRSAMVALSEGPILCLNLLNLDPDKDQVVEKSFSVSTSNHNGNSVTLPLQSLYNTDKFWYPSDESYLNAIDTYLSEGKTNNKEKWDDKILHFANIGNKPISILVKKASDYESKGYQLTLNDWYGAESVPEYLNGTSYVSDYMVTVYVVGGDFGPSLEKTHLISAEGMDDCDGNGECKLLNVYALDDSSESTKSPYHRFSGDIQYQSYFDEKGFIRGENDANLIKFLNLPSVNVIAKYVGSLIPNFVDKLGNNIWIQKLVNDDVDTVGLLCTENSSLIENVDDNGEFICENIDLIGNNVFADKIAGENVNDIESDFNFLSYNFAYNNVVKQQIKVGGVSYTRDENDDVDNQKHSFAWKKNAGNTLLYSDSSYVKVGAKLYDSATEDNTTKSVDEITTDVNPLMVEFNYQTEVDEFYVDSDCKTSYLEKDNEVILDINANVVVGDYLLSDYNSISKKSRLTRVVEVRNVFKNNSKAGILVICADKISKIRGVDDNMIIKITPIDKLADRLHWVCLNGFKVNKDSMPNGTNEQQNKILDMLREEPLYSTTNTTLFKSLIDRDYTRWRYIVDTFGLGIEPECKNVYTKLCQERKSGLAIINCPSQLDFKKSQNPSFTNKAGGVDVEYIAAGGDLSKNPSFLFSLPKIENGASWGAYYYPYLRITDLGSAKSVPPAAYVSNLYIRKYDKGFAWSIVAGQKRGVISGNQVVGVEATLVSDNRDWLEPVGINSIIWENGVGVEVYGNKTAKQTPVSALSSVHVREAAIYIQDGVETILKKYMFEFNTSQTRMEIKTLVDEYLNTMKSNGGIYDFRTVMDTTNNTAEVIDSNKAVIDIYVEVARGLEIIAQRLTIMKTGAIASGFGD